MAPSVVNCLPMAPSLSRGVPSPTSWAVPPAQQQYRPMAQVDKAQALAHVVTCRGLRDHPT